MRVVFLGDSLIYGYGVRRKLSWVSLASARLGIEAVNRGVNGDTTYGMYARFDSDVLAWKPDAVFLMGGCNDVFTAGTADGARAQMARMAALARGHGIAPLVGTAIPLVPPAARRAWGPLTDFSHALAELEQYTAWLKRGGAGDGVPVCDFWTVFRGRTEARYFPDGVHPTEEGHRWMAEAFCAFYGGL